MCWDDESDGVFVYRDGVRIVGRVVKEADHWEWASYRGGKAPTFLWACKAAEASIESIRQQSPSLGSYRDQMRDAGRGHLVRDDD
jgi:hypothetical protein